MQTIKLLVRLVLAVVGGWYFGMLLLFAIGTLVDVSVWGLVHTGAPLILWLVLAPLIYWLIGRIPSFRSGRPNRGNERERSDESASVAGDDA